MANKKLEDSFEKTLSKKKQFVNPIEVLKQTSLSQNMTVADFGCGTGYISFAAVKIVNPNGIVYALDIRRDALRSIESQKKLFGERNIKTLKTDLMVPGGVDIPDKSVDLVILATIIFQLPDTRVLFDETKRILKDGGEVLVLEWNKKKNGGLGPPVNERISQKDIKKLISEEGYKVTNNLKTDSYHYGYVLK